MRKLIVFLLLALLCGTAAAQQPVQVQSRVGPQTNQDGAVVTPRLSKDGSTATQDIHARYQEAVYRGNVYFAATTAANPTAFSGAAGGTPLIGVMNPAGSGKILVLLQIRIGVRTNGTAAINQDFELYGGPSALPTGTVTAPTNMLSLQSSGSQAKAFLNTAITASTAINAIFPSCSVGTTPATTDTKSTVLCVDDVQGLVEVLPGNLIALGAAATPTAGSYDATLIWEEIPQ